jgi:GNAT superfamily N-acetyltransferase
MSTGDDRSPADRAAAAADAGTGSAGTGPTFRELPAGDPGWTTAFPILRQLRPHLTREDLATILAEGAPQGLTFTGAFRGEVCVGLAGWRVVDTTSVLRKLYVDDLVTDASSRSTGVGAALLGQLESVAATRGCAVLELDSGHQRVDAHRFYLREGFEDVSRHFRRRVRGR